MDAAEQSAAAADAVQGGDTERYFLPLRLACESKVARVMEVRPCPCFAARWQHAHEPAVVVLAAGGSALHPKADRVRLRARQDRDGRQRQEMAR